MAPSHLFVPPWNYFGAAAVIVADVHAEDGGATAARGAEVPGPHRGAPDMGPAGECL